MHEIKVVDEFLFLPIHDPLMIPSELNRVAEEQAERGQSVRRGPLGSVIISLLDGEVHFIPSGRGIDCVIYERR